MSFNSGHLGEVEAFRLRFILVVASTAAVNSLDLEILNNPGQLLQVLVGSCFENSIEIKYSL